MNGSLKEELELVEQTLLVRPGGSCLRDIHDEDIHELERYLELWSMDGQLMYRSAMLRGRPLGNTPDVPGLGKGWQSRSYRSLDGARFRVAEKLGNAGGQPVVIRLAVGEAGHFSETHGFLTLLLVGVPLALVLLSICAYVLTRRALKPISLMALTAGRIGANNLMQRIPVKNADDELGELASSFNDLLARVERSFGQLRRFTSDASHELRTPLTAMRTVGEVSLQVGRSDTEYREVIGSMLEESARLTKMVDNLLFLSRADSGKHIVKTEQFDLSAFAEETTGIISILAEEKKQSFHFNGRPGIVVSADRVLLSQALLNLIDNAIKFTPVGGEINVNVDRDEKNRGFIEVIDSGPGIPPTEQERIFDRFYRLKNKNGGGAGLGLAIALWAVEANGGTIRVRSSESSGSNFSIIFSQKESSALRQS